METVMVDAEIPGYFHDMQPSGSIHGGIAGLREDHAVVLAAQEGLSAVNDKVCPVGGKGAQSTPDKGVCDRYIHLAAGEIQTVYGRLFLVPERRGGGQIHLQGKVMAARLEHYVVMLDFGCQKRPVCQFLQRKVIRDDTVRLLIIRLQPDKDRAHLNPGIAGQ